MTQVTSNERRAWLHQSIELKNQIEECKNITIELRDEIESLKILRNQDAGSIRHLTEQLQKLQSLIGSNAPR